MRHRRRTDFNRSFLSPRLSSRIPANIVAVVSLGEEAEALERRRGIRRGEGDYKLQQESLQSRRCGPNACCACVTNRTLRLAARIMNRWTRNWSILVLCSPIFPRPPIFCRSLLCLKKTGHNLRNGGKMTEGMWVWLRLFPLVLDTLRMIVRRV